MLGKFVKREQAREFPKDGVARFLDVMSARCQVELRRNKSALISSRGGGKKSQALEVQEQTQTWQAQPLPSPT